MALAIIIRQHPIKQNTIKKSHIRETKNLSTDADSRTNTIFEMLSDLSQFFYLFIFERLGDFEKKGGGGHFFLWGAVGRRGVDQ